jgi:heme-degrading monooxygenase HmoA
MHAVIREATYAADLALQDTPEFRDFQQRHAALPGYRGTLVVDLNGGRYLTVTLWESEQHLRSGREAMSPVVARTVERLMTGPSVLHGTGVVVVNDLAEHLGGELRP